MSRPGFATEVFRTADGAEIAYRIRPGSAPLVLLHGLGHDASLWDAVVAALPAERGVVLPELRGHGGSTLGWRAPGVDLWAEDVLALLDARAIGRPAVAGLSLGGYVTLAVAAARPGFARGYGLVSTSAAADDEAGRSRRAAALATIRREGWRAFLRDQLPGYLDPAREGYADAVARVTAMFERAGDSGLPPALIALAGRPDRRGLLRSIAAPAVVVTGTADPVTPPEAARTIAAGIPGARLRLLEGVAHLSALESPREIAELLESL